MFADAIDQIHEFTKPIHSIVRYYDGRMVPGTATLFFVNENGVAITCKHVVEFIIQSEKCNAAYQNFKQEKQQLPRDQNYATALQHLEKKYQYRPNAIVQIQNQFLNAIDGFKNLKIHMHPFLDLAIIEFQQYETKRYQSCAQFVQDEYPIRQGEYLCRLGYPFPEFNNYAYNDSTDDVQFTQTGQTVSPRFPIDGIITRFGIQQGLKATIEMSTPGLRGQSGGPLFDRYGRIFGMQSMTSHLHLGFDMMNREVLIDGVPTKVSNSPFLHVGHCIHADRIKDFLKEHRIPFYISTQQTESL